MGKKDAEITVGADASALERVTAVGKAAFRDLGNSIKSSIGDASQQVVTDLGNVVLAQGKISFAQQHQDVRAYEQATARLAVSTQQSSEQIRSSYDSMGVSMGKRPQEVAAWTLEVGRLSYNYDEAAKSLNGMDQLARATGRNAGDYKGLAVEMAMFGHVTDDASHAVGVLKSQSDILGTTGGVAALADQMEGLSDVMSRVGGKSESVFSTMSALAGELGKGLNPAAAKRVQQSVLGEITGDTVGWSRFLGRDITDEHGQVDAKQLPAILQEITQRIKKTYGRDARRMLQLQFGAEGGAALFNADFGEVQRLANAPASPAPAAAQKAYLETDAGKRDVAQADLAVSSRHLLGSSTALGTAADKLQAFAANNPITSTLLSTAFGGALSSFMSTFGTSLATMMGGKGAGGAVGGVMDLATKGTSAAGKVLPVVGAGLAGFGLGWELAGGQEHIDQEYQQQLQTRTPEDEKRSRELLLQREVAARVRSAKGLTTGTSVNGWTPSAEDNAAATLAAGGTKEGLAALVAQLKKEGASDENAEKVAKAVADALQRAFSQAQIQAAPDTPASLSIRMGGHPAAGNQNGK